jgi:hypothetical protein
MADDPIGKRFSHVYVTRGEGLQDSIRARVRIAKLLASMKLEDYRIVEWIESEMGTKMPSTGYGYLVEKFVERVDLDEFLDLISLIWARFGNQYHLLVQENWIPQCRRIFAEERLRYVINDAGGVRLSTDAQFVPLPAHPVRTRLISSGIGHRHSP